MEGTKSYIKIGSDRSCVICQQRISDPNQIEAGKGRDTSSSMRILTRYCQVDPILLFQVPDEMQMCDNVKNQYLAQMTFNLCQQCTIDVAPLELHFNGIINAVNKFNELVESTRNKIMSAHIQQRLHPKTNEEIVDNTMERLCSTAAGIRWRKEMIVKCLPSPRKLTRVLATIPEASTDVNSAFEIKNELGESLKREITSENVTYTVHTRNEIASSISSTDATVSNEANESNDLASGPSSMTSRLEYDSVNKAELNDSDNESASEAESNETVQLRKNVNFYITTDESDDDESEDDANMTVPEELNRKSQTSLSPRSFQRRKVDQNQNDEKEKPTNCEKSKCSLSNKLRVRDCQRRDSLSTNSRRRVTVRCSYCKIEFENPQSLNDHQLRVHTAEKLKNHLPDGTTQKDVQFAIDIFISYCKSMVSKRNSDFVKCIYCKQIYKFKKGATMLILHLIKNHKSKLSQLVRENKDGNDEHSMKRTRSQKVSSKTRIEPEMYAQNTLDSSSDVDYEEIVIDFTTRPD